MVCLHPLLIRHGKLLTTAKVVRSKFVRRHVPTTRVLGSVGTMSSIPQPQSLLVIKKQQKQRSLFESTPKIQQNRSLSSSSSTIEEAEYLCKDEEHKETLKYQAETKQLLDIVTHSLYTDKEVFLRELISNASDALEKLRHVQQTIGSGDDDSSNKMLVQSIDELPLEIRIETDEMNNTLTISDSGIGMNRDDMISNLGTIAKSGSKEFVNQMKEATSSENASDIIGKFGVGFYSSFMVGDKVQVRSKPAVVTLTKNTTTPTTENDSEFDVSKAQLWSSTGVGTYDISDLSDDVRQDRGSSIVIHLKDDCIQYSDEKTIENILKKYSNFVGFPIYLNGNRINLVEALWTKSPSDIKQKTYDEFYKYIAKSPYQDEPLDKLHYKADVPIDIKALFFIPSFHSEKYGMGRMEPGVSLYSRKVLIENKCKDILPDWLRFIKGVVDSEDLPLSISREKPQDTALIQKLRKALTRKIITHLTTMSKKRPDVYKEEFYKEYSFFLKEGVCQDYDFQEPLSKLLYYETNKGMAKEISSLDEYISRCKPEQKDIYYLVAPSRTLALQSPYIEAFEKSGIEVIFVYSAIDDFVMANLEKYEGRNLVSADKSDIRLPGSGKTDDDDDDDDDDEKDGDSKDGKTEDSLKEDDANEFCTWFQQTIGEERVLKCIVTDRLSSSPAVVTDNESGAMRRMMRLVDTTADADSSSGGREDGVPLPKQIVEINPNHPIIIVLNSVRNVEPTLAKVCAEQLFDNCLISAGILDDSRSMIPRINDILLSVVKSADPSLKK